MNEQRLALQPLFLRLFFNYSRILTTYTGASTAPYPKKINWFRHAWTDTRSFNIIQY